MKNIILGLIFLSFLFVPMVSLSQVPPIPPGPPPDSLKAGVNPWITFQNIVKWVFSIFLVVAVLFIILAAYYFVTAQGNMETVGKARTFVLYAVIGIIVAAVAQGLVQWIRGIAESQ